MAHTQRKPPLGVHVDVIFNPLVSAELGVDIARHRHVGSLRHAALAPAGPRSGPCPRAGRPARAGPPRSRPADTRTVGAPWRSRPQPPGPPYRKEYELSRALPFHSSLLGPVPVPRRTGHRGGVSLLPAEPQGRVQPRSQV